MTTETVTQPVTTAATTTTTEAQTTATTQPAAFDWKGSLGDGYAAHEPLIQAKGWKGPGDVLAGYSNLEKLVGNSADRVTLPGKDAKPEDLDAFYGKLGRPEKPDGYQFQKPEGVEGYDDAFAAKFRDIAHKNGLTPRQAAALHDWQVENTKTFAGDSAKAAAEHQAQYDKAVAAEWGAAAPEKFTLANRAVIRLARDLGLDEAKINAGSLVIEKTLGGFAAAKMLAAYGETLQEDKLQGKGGGASTPADAKGEMARLRADPEFNAAWMNRGHVGHAEAVRRMAELGSRANPQATTEVPR